VILKDFESIVGQNLEIFGLYL